MLTRLEQIFEQAKNQRRAAFIAYVMAGDPDLETTHAVLSCLSAARADLIELGIPYGDPLADGPTIVAAAQRSLKNGTSLADVFRVLERHRKSGGAPVVLFSYFNPIYQYGIERFTRTARVAGAVGVIVPDLALDESLELRASARSTDLQMPLLVAPTTSSERAARIAEAATGFVYVVSRLGVTGANATPNVTQVRRQVAMLRGVTKKPLAVGFGVSSAASVREVTTFADGVMVGSALISAYAGTRGDEAVRHLRTFVEPLVAATAWEGVTVS
jgi:tryptophan synthase alpha chain